MSRSLHVGVIAAVLLAGGVSAALADPPCGRGWRKGEYCGPRGPQVVYAPPPPVVYVPPPPVYVAPVPVPVAPVPGISLGITLPLR